MSFQSSNFQLLSIDSVTFISVSLSYSVYLRKPILSLPLSLSLSQSDLASLSNGLVSLSLSLKPPTPNSLFLKPILLFSQILYARDLGLSMFLCFIYVRDLGFFVLISGSFQLNVFFFNRFFFLLIPKLKKKKKGVGLVTLTAAPNWVLIEYQIDSNWKLED